MRLIDADKLEKDVEYYISHTIVNTNENYAYNRCKGLIKQQPTIEAEPVVHGEWDDRANPQWPAYDIRHCSVCGWNIPKTKLRNKDANWNYCPNCGANMKGAKT